MRRVSILFAAARTTAVSVLLAVLAVSVTLTVDHIWDGGFTVSDQSLGTLLQVVATVAGVFLGLYFGAITTTAGAVYQDASAEVRSLFLNDRVGNAYVRFLAFLAAVAVILLGALALGITVGSRYNASGDRVHKWVEPDDDETLYVAGIFEIDRNSSNTTQQVRSLINAGGQFLAVRTWDTSSWTTDWVFGDQVASVTATYDGNNTKHQRGYYPYGEDRWNNGAFPSDHAYTGQTRDGDRSGKGTGLDYYKARYYDPATGSFISPDSIIPNPGVSIDLNRHAYVRGNPIRYNDPTGHVPLRPACLDGGVRCFGTNSSGSTVSASPNVGYQSMKAERLAMRA